MRVEDTAGEMIREINDELARQANNQLRVAGVTMSQIGLLLQLEVAPDGLLTVGELASKLHVSQPTASGLVNRLEKKRLVKVLGDPDDRRVRHVLLTGAGRQCCREGERNMADAEERLLHNLNADERAVFLALLRRVRDGLLG